MASRGHSGHFGGRFRPDAPPQGLTRRPFPDHNDAHKGDDGDSPRPSYQQGARGHRLKALAGHDRGIHSRARRATRQSPRRQVNGPTGPSSLLRTGPATNNAGRTPRQRVSEFQLTGRDPRREGERCSSNRVVTRERCALVPGAYRHDVYHGRGRFFVVLARE